MRTRSAALTLAATLVLASVATQAGTEPADLDPLGIPDATYPCPFGRYEMVRYPGGPNDNITFTVVTGPESNPLPDPRPTRLQQQWGAPRRRSTRTPSGRPPSPQPPGRPTSGVIGTQNSWGTRPGG